MKFEHPILDNSSTPKVPVDKRKALKGVFETRSTCRQGCFERGVYNEKGVFERNTLAYREGVNNEKGGV